MSAAATATIILKRHGERRDSSSDSGGELTKAELAEQMAHVTPGTRFVNVRQVHHYVQEVASIKGFVFYCVYFAFFFSLLFYRFDVNEAQSTLSWYSDAIQSTYDAAESDAPAACLPGAFGPGNDLNCFRAFTDLSSEADLVGFVQEDLSRYISGIVSYCPQCGIAVTVGDQDLIKVDSLFVICSDFVVASGSDADSVAREFGVRQSAAYAKRDCDAADAAFRAAPDARAYPCCEDGRLRLASLILKVSFSTGGPETAPLDALQKPEAVARASAAYVKLVLDAQTSVAQVVVRRDTHFVGVVYKAGWVDERWVPGLISPSLSYWSRLYSSGDDGVDVTDTALLVIASIGFVLSTVHELVDLFARHLSWAELGYTLINPYTVIFWLPSIVLPWWLPLIGENMGLAEFPTLVVAVEMIMFVRLFAEGEALPPFRIIVRTLSSAARQLASFCFAMGTTITVFAAMNSQLSGAFDSTNAPFVGAFSAAFDVIVQGAPLDGDSFAVIPGSALFMYYVLNLFLFLILAQFFIAILVDSFDNTRQAEEGARTDRSLPSGFRAMEHPCRGTMACTLAAAHYAATYWAFGRPGPLLERELLFLLRQAQGRMSAWAELRAEDYEEAALMLPERELAAVVGKTAASAIVCRFGAELVPGREHECMQFVVPPAETVAAHDAKSDGADAHKGSGRVRDAWEGKPGAGGQGDIEYGCAAEFANGCNGGHAAADAAAPLSERRRRRAQRAAQTAGSPAMAAPGRNLADGFSTLSQPPEPATSEAAQRRACDDGSSAPLPSVRPIVRRREERSRRVAAAAGNAGAGASATV